MAMFSFVKNSRILQAKQKLYLALKAIITLRVREPIVPELV